MTTSVEDNVVAPSPCARRNAYVSWRGGGIRRVQRVQNASAYVACLVIEQVAVDEGGRSLDVGPTALHAKVCNQSRNVPAGRWKKGPEGSKMRARTE